MPLRAVPSPASALTAAELLARIREKGGRPYRMKDEGVYVLTDDESVAAWLLDLGGHAYRAAGMSQADGSFSRARGGKTEWDIWVHTIPVTGPSLWEVLRADA